MEGIWFDQILPLAVNWTVRGIHLMFLNPFDGYPLDGWAPPLLIPQMIDVKTADTFYTLA